MFYFLVRCHSASPDVGQCTHLLSNAPCGICNCPRCFTATVSNRNAAIGESFVGVDRWTKGQWSQWMLPNGGQQDLPFTHWGPGEPSSGPDCMAITSAFRFDDSPCSDTKVFVCNN